MLKNHIVLKVYTSIYLYKKEKNEKITITVYFNFAKLCFWTS